MILSSICNPLIFSRMQDRVAHSMSLKAQYILYLTTPYQTPRFHIIDYRNAA